MNTDGKHGKEARLIPLTTVEQFLALQASAARDQHTVICPSHLIVKNEMIVGYASIGNVAVLNCWVSTRHVNKFESVRLLREGEQRLAAQGYEWLILPVAKVSPFRRFVQKLGYYFLGESGFNLKRLRGAPAGEGAPPGARRENGEVQTVGRKG